MVSMEQESLCPLIIQLLICSAAAALAANYIVPTCLLWQPTYQPARTHGEQNDHPSFLTLLSVTVSNFLQLLMVLTHGCFIFQYFTRVFSYPGAMWKSGGARQVPSIMAS
jgi:hypothetical protein